MRNFGDFGLVTSASVLQDTTPVMTKIYSTLGRKYSQKDLEEAQRLGEDIVNMLLQTFFKLVILPFEIVWILGK